MDTKINVYIRTTLILSLLLAISKALCFQLCFDPSLGYFDPKLPVFLTRALTWISALWCASPLLLIPKDSIVTQNEKTPLCVSGTAVAATLVSLAGAGLFITSVTSNNKPSLVCGALLFVGSAFFWTALGIRFKSNTPIGLGVLAILSFLSILVVSHFDMLVAINSPIKAGLQLTVVAILLFLLSESRTHLGTEAPRAGFVFKLLTVLFCFPTAVAHFLLYFSNNAPANSEQTLNPFFSLALLGVGTFAVIRLCAVKPAPAPEEAETEKEIEEN